MLGINTAILDGDIIAYRASFWADQEGHEWLENRLQDDIKRWTPPGIESVIVALSCSRKDNIRKDYLPTYKEHREGRPRPDCLNDAIQFLRDNYTVVAEDRLEADDLMGIYKSDFKAICVTIDKDLKQVPGYSWQPQLDKTTEDLGIEYTSVADANLWFHRQWITGDSTDNIPGIWKLGQKKAEKLLNETSTKNHTALVLSLYERRRDRNGDPYTLDDAIAMGRCVRILRAGDKTPWNPYE